MNYQDKNSAIKYVLERLKDKLGLEKLSYEGSFESATSYVYKFKLCSVDTQRRIIVKLYKIGKSIDVDVPSSENESIFLEQLSQYCFDIRDVVIPRPIAYLPEVNGVVREYVDGVNLQKLMSLYGRFSSKNEKRRLIVYFMKVGRVIGLIHARTYKSNTDKPKFYLNAKLERIKSQLHYSHLGPPLQQYVDDALKCIKDGISVLSSKNCGIVWTHGEFIHSNILITNQHKVALLDFAESRFDSPYHDISRFIVRTLIDYGYNPLRYSTKYLLKLNHVFLKSYLSSFPYRIHDEVLHLYYIFQIIQFISFLYKSNVLNLLSPRDWYALLLLKKYCKNPLGEELDEK
jgi:RIO-like serine/threonine protein kinase